MRKSGLFILIFFINLVCLHAQKSGQYLVFSVTGNVTKGNIQIEPKQLVNASDEIVIAEGAQVSLLDEAGKRVYAIGEPGTHRIKTITGKMEPSVKVMSANYIKYIKDHLFGTDKKYSDKTYITGVSTVGFRGEEEDLLFMKSLFAKFDFRNPQLLTTLFNQKEIEITSDYNLLFEFVSYKDQSLLQNNRNRQNPYFVRVINKENTPLFVNILAINEKGDGYLILKPHEQYGFLNHCVPPYSIISFLDQPFTYTDNKTVCFICVASEFPIDFRLLEKYKELDTTPTPEIEVGFVVHVVSPE